MISSATALRQRYGRFEAKIKLNRCALTSCFWMLGDTEVPHVEIMKCEADGVHMGRVYSYRTAVNKDIQLIKELELDNAYYIFTLEWTENGVDGKRSGGERGNRTYPGRSDVCRFLFGNQ